MLTETQKQKMADENEQVRERVSRIKHRILVLSGKGGVGKSTVAANLAVSLALKARRVGLLDVDVHGPSIPHLMGLAGSPVETTGAGNGSYLLNPVPAMQNLHVMSIGFLLESRDSAVIWRGPMKYNMIKQFLKDVQWGDLDYLVVDSPPGTGDEPLTVAQLLGPPSHAVIVTTPQELALTDVRKCVTFCRQVQVPIAGVIENMSGFVCPHCGKRSPIFKTGGGRALAQEMGIPFLGGIPLDPGVVSSGDEGTPHVQRFAQSAAARAFAAVVERITGTIEGSA
ncbi:MAG: Mrp/NBP35 family ATP-binding protein [Phycisphaerae bacterium]|nr:Mrp/NBP35 family ATP-binding protein [Phycisphaerae bacterium]